MRLSLLLVSFLLFYGLQAQVDPIQEAQEDRKTLAPENGEQGLLVEEKDERLDLLIQDYNDKKVVKGYRIQLFAGNSKMEALKIKADFLTKYEETVPDVVYHSPNFKVRVGNYRDRLEAYRFLKLYKEDFPSAFIVKDEVKASSLFEKETP